MKKGMSPSEIKKLGEITNIQLNLNVKDKSLNLGEDIVAPYSVISNTLYVNNDKTYIRYLDYYRNLYYNNSIELTEADYWLVLLTSRDYMEFNDILSNFVDDNLRIELVKEVIFLSNDDYLFSEEERMNLDLLVKFEEEKRIEQEKKKIMEEAKIEGHKQGIKQGIEQGIEQGIKQGIKEGIKEGKENQTKDFIKNLLDNNVSIENISLYCNLPINEINNIINTLNK